VTLLELCNVTLSFKRGRRGVREQVLCDTSFAVHRGEATVVWGTRRSGRTTLLQVAAGIRGPDAGFVTFAGIDLRRRAMLGASGGIAYAMTRFEETIAESVLEHVAAPLMGGRCAPAEALARAHNALARVDAAACAELRPPELDDPEAVRVGIARALVTQPSLLLLDEPTDAVPPARSRDVLLELIHSLSRDDELAIVRTTGDAASLAGADRAFTLDGGRLRGPTATPKATVIQLRAAVSSARTPQVDGSSPEKERR